MNKSELRRLTIQGMLLEGAYWFGFCTYVAFIIITLIDNGWSDSAATGAMTAMSVIILLMQPVYGYIGDHFLSEKKLTVLLLTLAVVFLGLLPFSIHNGNIVLILANMVGVTLTGTQIAGLLDAWIVGLKQEFPALNYGLMRGTGSLAFAVSAQTMGIITDKFGHDVRIWIGCGMLVFAVLMALAFRSARRVNKMENENQPAKKPGGAESFRLIFSSKQYCLLTGVSFFMLLCNASVTTLIQLCIRDFGGTTAQMGTASAVCAISEVPCMFLMAYIMRRTGEKKLILFSSMAYAVRMILMAMAGSVNGLILVQLLQGISYAVLVPVSMSYLAKIVDERVRSTAVTTYAAITGSLTGILANFITSASLAAGLTAQNTLIFFAASAMCGFFLALYGSVRKIW